jgi:glycosyltransferase involved in cell wall biosynthesis
MRIGIDARYLSHGIMGGINSYLRNLLPALFEIAEDHIIFLYADTKRPFELADLPGNVVLRLVPYQNAFSSIYYDFNLRRTMVNDQLDIIHFPANYGFGPMSTCSVITLHDEINLMPLGKILRGHPKNARTMVTMTYLHFCTSRAVRKVDMVVTISEYARRKILQWGSLPERKVTAIHHGAPLNVQRVVDTKEIERVRQIYEIKKDFVLADALKNPGVLSRAWKLLPEHIREDKEIIFFSRMENVRPEVHEAVQAGYAKFILRPERNNLNALFSMATVFVFPSWIEGFGIPLLEAMICGAPVIASDRGAIPEVLGGAGLVIDAEDHQKLAELLENLFRNPEERDRLRARGYERVQKFSWKESAARLLEAYQGLVENRQLTR